MSDQIVTNPAVPPAEPAKPTATMQEKTGGKTYTDEEVQQIVKERLEREKANEAKRLEEAQKKTAAETAAKQGEWQKLAEQREQEAKELKARLEAIELSAKKHSIGVKHGLPDEIADRLIGTTDAELEADAERLAKIVPKPSKPAPGPVNPGANGQQQGETIAQQRARIHGQTFDPFNPETARKMGGGVILKGNP